MFRPDETTVAQVHDLIQCLAAVDYPQSTALEQELSRALAAKRPDLTSLLLHLAKAAHRHGLALGRVIMAACCRAFAAKIAETYPGHSIELRIPPFAAVQVGFGEGPTHRRGTPPNVVELSPEAFVPLCVGLTNWQDTSASSSGAQAQHIAQAFPLVGDQESAG